MKLGLSGRLTQATIRSPLTPLFLLAALAVGLVALLTIPREEEPQISVPMVDIRVNADGLKAPDAVELVTKPLEAIVKGIDGVEHVYSQTVDDRVMVTARFKVGTNADDAILRVHEKIRANLDRIPVGIPEPLIVGRGINDVAVVVLTLSPKPDGGRALQRKGPLPDRARTAVRAGEDRQCRPHLHLRRQCAADPGRARPGKARALRRHAAAAGRPRCARPTARSWPATCATTAACATWPPGRRSPASPISACCW